MLGLRLCCLSWAGAVTSLAFTRVPAGIRTVRLVIPPSRKSLSQLITLSLQISYVTLPAVRHETLQKPCLLGRAGWRRASVFRALWWGALGCQHDVLFSCLCPVQGNSNLGFALCSRCGRPEGCQTLVYRGTPQELATAARMWALTPTSLLRRGPGLTHYSQPILETAFCSYHN